MEKRRPELIKKIVALDVGGAVEPSPAGLVIIVSYHLWLIAAFRVGGVVGDTMARTFARLVGAPDAARVATATSCYPYYHWWKRKLDKSQEQIQALVPEAPVLFLYGTAGYKSYLVRLYDHFLAGGGAQVLPRVFPSAPPIWQSDWPACPHLSSLSYEMCFLPASLRFARFFECPRSLTRLSPSSVADVSNYLNKSMQMFHADWWAKKLDKKEGSGSVPMTGSKHWITRDQPDDLNRRLDAFLDEG